MCVGVYSGKCRVCACLQKTTNEEKVAQGLAGRGAMVKNLQAGLVPVRIRCPSNVLVMCGSLVAPPNTHSRLGCDGYPDVESWNPLALAGGGNGTYAGVVVKPNCAHSSATLDVQSDLS